MNPRFEFSAPGTPQQNGVVERAFATLYDRVQAMLNYQILKVTYVNHYGQNAEKLQLI